jgi:hypothetical protein
MAKVTTTYTFTNIITYGSKSFNGKRSPTKQSALLMNRFFLRHLDHTGRGPYPKGIGRKSAEA